ncbi:type III secretion protein [Pseudomonas kairouanensis]|uniref:Type III secretion protein n=1 Tax=Pseudomonas kairouanensis TaxID=2293832 RepID=A0A4Z0AKS9_9PSED|nr:type III secretion protein [Pseudomonas kairouanensis]
MDGRQPHVQLFEQDDELSLQCHELQVVLRVQLTHPGLDIYPMQAWQRLGQASLAHFKGALALSPVTGQLWLVQGLARDCSLNHLMSALEALLNQRDTWRCIVARLAKPAHTRQALALRKPLH